MYRELVVETILGFIFWSIFLGIGPMIWFFPMFELDITGYEALVLCTFTPIITGIPGVLGFLQVRSVLTLLRLGAVASLASFQASTPQYRLFYLAAGSGANSLVLVSTLYSKSQKRRCLTYWGLILGLVAMLVGRIWLTSFIPPFWNNFLNNVTMAVGFIAVCDRFFSGEENLQNDVKVSESSSAQQPLTKPPSSIITGVAFGSLLYLTVALFADVHVISRWTNSGYPDPGPSAFYGGICLFVSVLSGLMVVPSVFAHTFAWWILGSSAFLSLYFLQTWTAFFGGILLCMYTFSLWPSLTNRLMQCPPARTLTMAFLVYYVLVFFSVWTIAYNFVPLGVYTREHTGYIVFLVILAQGLALFYGGGGQEDNGSTSESVRYPTTQKCAYKLLFVLLLLGLGGFASRLPSHEAIGSHAVKQDSSHRDFKALIWTFHFGMDNKGWPSLERAVKALNHTDADFITLLESDASKPFHGNHDVVLWLGERLGLYTDFGPSTRDHTWGNAVLSKYPIVKSTHHLLPSPHGELAPAVSATLNISGSLVDFVVTHMGNDRDVLDRELQANFLAEETSTSVNPVVFLGYVTSAPFSRDYKTLTEEGRLKDIDETDYKRWCEYIMYRGLIRLAYGRITHGELTDTEIQVASFRIPENPKDYRDNTQVVTETADVPKETLLSHKFGGFHRHHGYFGASHRYHMGTPKYFLP